MPPPKPVKALFNPDNAKVAASTKPFIVSSSKIIL
jgi:hypothetical protein